MWRSSSPRLLQHADGPIDWRELCRVALELGSDVAVHLGELAQGVVHALGCVIESQFDPEPPAPFAVLSGQVLERRVCVDIIGKLTLCRHLAQFDGPGLRTIVEHHVGTSSVPQPTSRTMPMASASSASPRRTLRRNRTWHRLRGNAPTGCPKMPIPDYASFAFEFEFEPHVFLTFYADVPVAVFIEDKEHLLAEHRWRSSIA